MAFMPGPGASGSQPPAGAAAAPKKANGLKFELNDRQKADIKAAFDLFDHEGVGKIEVRYLKVAIRGLGFEPKKEELKKMAADIDKDGKGYLSYDEILQLMTLKMSEKDSKEELIKSFRLFDENDTGRISFNQLKKVAKHLGEVITDEELHEMIDEADHDQDGVINLDEFLKIMKKAQNF